jgi:hypothetical protein
MVPAGSQNLAVTSRASAPNGCAISLRWPGPRRRSRRHCRGGIEAPLRRRAYSGSAQRKRVRSQLLRTALVGRSYLRARRPGRRRSLRRGAAVLSCRRGENTANSGPGHSRGVRTDLCMSFSLGLVTAPRRPERGHQPPAVSSRPELTANPCCRGPAAAAVAHS